MNKTQKIHLTIWIIYTVYYLIAYSVIYGRTFDTLLVVNVSFINITFAIAFYGCLLYIFPKYLENKKYIALIIGSLSFVFFSATFRILSFKYVFPIMFSNAEKQELNYSEFAINFWNTQIYVFYALGYNFAQRVIHQQIEIGKQKDINAHLAQEKAQSEFQFLRSQVNPHFMFNTLNMVYNEVRKVNAEMSEVVIQFAGMMRYATSKAMQQDEVNLQGEFQFVEDYLDIQKRRFKDSLQLDCKIEGDIRSQRIVPMVLFTFVENAIKHGFYEDPDFPLLIRGNVFYDRFTFLVHNRKNPEPSGFDTGETGISITNLRKRLEAVYKNGGYSLEIEDLEDEYIVNFKINFNEVKNKS
jgi:two-component system, LytTR family, sensor kinase